MDLLDQMLEEARLRQSLPDPAVRRLLRKRAGLSQEQVAEAITAGGVQVGRVAVTRWENGSRTPHGQTAAAYARLLERLARAPETTDPVEPERR